MLFEITLIGFGVFVVFCIVMAFLNKTAYRRVKDAASAQVGKAARIFWSSDPLAVKNAEIDRLAEEVAAGRVGLENCRALMNSVEREAKSREQESNRLEALAKQYVSENNDEKALAILTEKENVDSALAKAKEAFAMHKSTYEAYLTKIQHATTRIGQMRNEAREQGSRLQMSKAEANLAKLAPFMGRNLSFDNMDEINQEIESQIDSNKARGQVVHDMAKEGLEEMEAEQRAKASSAKGKLDALKESMKV